MNVAVDYAALLTRAVVTWHYWGYYCLGIYVIGPVSLN
jgi:hypothetical protein